MGSILEAEVINKLGFTLEQWETRKKEREWWDKRIKGKRSYYIEKQNSLPAAYPSLLSSRPLGAPLGGGDVSMGSWFGLIPSEEACPGLESELSWGANWLDMEEPEGRMGTLLKRAGEKSLLKKEEETVMYYSVMLSDVTTNKNQSVCFSTLCPAERYTAAWFVFCRLLFSSPPASSEDSARWQNNTFKNSINKNILQSNCSKSHKYASNKPLTF